MECGKSAGGVLVVRMFLLLWLALLSLLLRSNMSRLIGRLGSASRQEEGGTLHTLAQQIRLSAVLDREHWLNYIKMCV